ncbi:MAG TPA: CRTAC1 family protein [Bryobacteraceae bacterium]|nr:CRTAC1 family protein [Bryobacteraceae bacterium]
MTRLAWLVLLGFSAGYSQIRFEEIAQKAGIHFQLKNGARGQFHQVELMPGGVAVLDYNNDGCLDIYFTNGAALPSLRKTGPEFHNRLYRNNCDLTFTDVTEKAGVAGDGYSMGVAAADYDNDGYTDIFVAGVNRNILYRNRGDGTFEDVTQKAGLSGIDPKYGKMWATSAGWFDYNNDGRLDLFVSNYVRWDPRTEPHCGSGDQRLYCHPDNYHGLPNQLFRNNGDGTFTDVSLDSGIGKHVGKGMGVAFADANGDGYPDVFVANDSVRNFLFENQRDGTFKEAGLEYCVALREDGAAIAGMGADFRDVDNDGLPDIFVTGMINDTFLLFRNLGKGKLFADETMHSRLAVETRQLTGWSAGIYDLDNDSWKDLFSANSHFPRLGQYLGRDSGLPNTVYRNLGNGRFEDVSSSAGKDLQQAGMHRGAAFGDFDNDGKIDVVVSVLNGAAKLFHNTSEGKNHWIAVRLIGSKSNRDGLGALVQVTLPDGNKLYNQATTSIGYASSSEPFVRFGLGKVDRATEIEVRWPGGGTQRLENVKADQLIIVRETDQVKPR